MLAVVHGEVAALEGEGKPAEPRPAFEQRDAYARVGECQRGGDPGEPSADYNCGPFVAVRVEPLGLCGVAHRAPSPAAVPWRWSGARQAVEVRDAVQDRRVAHRFPGVVSPWPRV